MSKDFYVYLHRKATTGEVFYVGKGCGYRAKIQKRNNTFWHSVVAKHGYVVELVAAGLQEWYAFELEKDLIAFYGRRDLGTGTLCNMCDGGTGAAGISEATRKKKQEAATGFKHSNETKEKLRALRIGKPASNKGVACSEATKQKLRLINIGRPSTFKGRTHSDESKRKQRQARLGKTMPAEAIAKIKASRLKVAVVNTAGMVFESMDAATKWLHSIGYTKAAPSSFRRACTGELQKAYGMQWRYATPEEVVALKEKGDSWSPLSELGSVA